MGWRTSLRSHAAVQELESRCALVLDAASDANWRRGVRGGHGEVLGARADEVLVASAWRAALSGDLLELLPWLILSNRRRSFWSQRKAQAGLRYILPSPRVPESQPMNGRHLP